MDIEERIETLLGTEAWLIDILPKTVPGNAGGRYFAVAEMLRRGRAEIDRRFLSFVLKLYCYTDVILCARSLTCDDPEPEELAEVLTRCFETEDYAHILLPEHDAMLSVMDGGDLYLVLYHPDEELKDLVSVLAGAEGLFFYPAPK